MRTARDGAYHWTHDKSLICRELTKRPSELTICLKTKDDSCFLETWITHHARIVGLQNLVIFDNMSTDEAVWTIYDKFHDQLLLVQFEEHSHAVHQISAFPELYASLRRSSAFYAFLDTDEFLVRIERENFYADPSIVEFIQSCTGANWLPATWLHNAYRSDDVFHCGNDISVLLRGLRWGKPVVRPTAVGKGCVLHNTELHSAIAATRTLTNLFLLHKKNLSPERRIAVLWRRLAARCKARDCEDSVKGFVSEGDDVRTVLTKDASHLTPTMKYEVFELRELLKLIEAPGSTDDTFGAGQVRFCPDGRVQCFGDSEKKLFLRYLAEPDAMIQEAFRR